MDDIQKTDKSNAKNIDAIRWDPYWIGQLELNIIMLIR
jgi:hypothetical protein